MVIRYEVYVEVPDRDCAQAVANEIKNLEVAGARVTGVTGYDKPKAIYGQDEPFVHDGE